VIISKVDDNYYFQNIIDSDKIELMSYNEEDKPVSKIYFDDEIYSISVSNKRSQVYVCLADERKISILDYNIDEKWIKLDDYEIEDNFDNIETHFNKCIDINNEDYLVSCDVKGIYFWKKKIENNNEVSDDDESEDIKNKYSIIRKIVLNTNTSDLLPVTNDYFISSQPDNKTITFINISNFSSDLIIPNIDCIDSTNSLYLLKDNIIVNCINGIAILSVKTKQLIQYLELFLDGDLKKICCNKENIFSVLLYKDAQKINIFELRLNNNCFDLYGKYKNIKIEKENNIDIISMNKKDIVLYGDNKYIMKEGEEIELESNIDSDEEDENEDGKEIEKESDEEEEKEENEDENDDDN